MAELRGIARAAGRAPAAVAQQRRDAVEIAGTDCGTGGAIDRLLERHRIGFDYRARSTDEKTRRSVSPQRLTHYRDNWYVDAWDEERKALRSFSIDRMTAVRVLPGAAEDVAEEELNAHLAGSYGIFSGAICLLIASRTAIARDMSISMVR